MAAFRIQYVATSPKPQCGDTLWVTPENYTVQQARESFIRQSPTVVVGSIIRLSFDA